MSSESFSPSRVSSDEEPVYEMANVVKKYGTEELIEYLRSKDLKLTESHFEILRKEKITGPAFLEQTKEDFRSIGLTLGPATVLANVITDLKTSNTPKSNTGLVYVFVDNSNLFIEGKYTVGRIEQAGNFDYQRNSYQLNQLYIDHGRLLSTVLKGRRIGSNSVIVGSRPPPNDSLWDRIRNQGYGVIVYDRIANKEKKADMELGLCIADAVYSKDPGLVLIVAGDGDYSPAINRALHHSWKVEVWFWSSGISGDLMRNSIFFLDNFYRHFTYAYGQDPAGRNYILEITDGETLAKWNDDEVMECFDSLEFFGWWFRKEGPTIYLYFDNKTNSRKAKSWVESNHPDVKVWEIEKRKSWSE
ncbi:9003_t:CDS:2 [Paraglomus occultum]|uniref:9003_t:CDS:1 n=1 Tax=Paraglomus occultum TaxID=144539 RepID=A0A9N9A139_9GLOM|nr:9003_t:CDS:2 [Paraglomus occultum]